MKNLLKIFVVLMLFIFQFTIFPSDNPRAEEIENNIILLIDNSGSMGKNDPDKLALVAASMLVDTLEASDKINIIAFGTRVQSPYRLRDNPSHDKLKTSLSIFDYGDKYTSLKDGLAEALTQLEEVKGNKRIIILSDGREDPEGGLTQAHSEELNALKEKAHSMKTSIYTIGLSENADKEMLSRLANDTGGTFFSCKNPADLFDIFGRVMGTGEGLHTLEKYITNSIQEKTINLSSYIEEIVIKTASIDNRNPNIKVLKDGIEVNPEKNHKKYKIYRIKNNKSSSFKIISSDDNKNVVIIQLRSRANIGVNTTDESFRIPARIPLDIKASIDVDSGGEIVNMYRIEGGRRELVNKENGAFGFTFQRDAKGEYQIVLVACDGNNNILAVRSIDVSITDYPPFYYTEQLPRAMITDKPIRVSLKPLGGDQVNSITAEVVADYGGSFEKFPLQLKDGVLTGELVFRKSGEIRLTTCVSGVYNNEPFSYYLPIQKILIGEKARLYLETVNARDILSKGKKSTLLLNIKDALLYQEEKIEVFDQAGSKIGDFIVKPNQIGKLTVNIMPANKTEELIITFKGQEDINLTRELRTGIRVLPPLKYFLSKYEGVLIGAACILFILLLAAIAGFYTYNNKVLNYKIVKEIYYRARGPFRILSIELGMHQRCVYLNLGTNGIYDSEAEERAIGYFELVMPDYHPIISGLLYIIRGKSMFRVKYDGILDQRVFEGYDDSSLPVMCKSDITIKFKDRNLNCEIQFQ